MLPLETGIMCRIRLLLVGGFLLTGSTLQLFFRTQQPRSTSWPSDTPEIVVAKRQPPEQLHNSEQTGLPGEEGKTVYNHDTHRSLDELQLDEPVLLANKSLSPLDKLKAPYPIFVASLPKSGTTSTSYYFNCGKIWTAHTFCNTQSNSTKRRKQMRVGQCYQENVIEGRPPFEDCGRYKVWSDGGHPKGRPCFYPSVHGLDAFYTSYPNATILLVTRNSTAWASSVQRWKDGSLLKQWEKCDLFPNKGTSSTLPDIEQFYEWHANNIRHFVASRPSLTYIEVALEHEKIGDELENAFGVDSSCFGHHNSHEKRMKNKAAIKRIKHANSETL